jgi:hypothetical protein
MSRTYLYQALVADAVSIAPGSLGDLGLNPGHIYTGEIDSPEGDLFLVLRFGETTPEIAPVNSGSTIVWAYERQSGDYLRLDKVLKRVRTMFIGIEAQKTNEGWITEVRWLGDSGDLADDIFHAITKNSSYNVIASGR